MAIGKAERAIPDFTRSLGLKPDFRNAYVNRANALFRLGHIHESLDDFHRAGMHPERSILGAGAVGLLAIGLAIRVLRRRAVV